MVQRMIPREELEDRTTDLEAELGQANADLGAAITLLEESTETPTDALPRHPWNDYHVSELKTTARGTH